VTALAGPDAYRQPLSGLSRAQMADYADGALAFGRRWQTALGSFGPWGLGPLANAESCAECHEGKGRTPPQADGKRLRAMVVRLSGPGSGPHGEAIPHAAYGDQLNDLGVLGVPAEGHAVMEYRDRQVVLADGTVVPLREPSLRFEDLQYGPLGDEARVSVRAAPPLIGAGLLEAVPEEALLERVAKQASLGLGGRINRVWDRDRGEFAVGRFGRKATQPTLPQQVAAAFHDDIGVTSKWYPVDACTNAQPQCLEAARFRVMDPELSPGILSDIVFYLRASAVPVRRNTHTPAVTRGEHLFAAVGCADCHLPTLPGGQGASLAELRGAEFHPYTDLLLHDLGEYLADGRPDGLAGERDWRTAPLWGLGLAAQVNPGVRLLHDGRARSTMEAILWHGGEGARSRAAFGALSEVDRGALLAFLDSL